jgi:putative ABC transport system permease protein
VEHRGELKFMHIQAFQENSTLRKFNVIEGKMDFSTGVLIGSLVADRLNVGPGDSVLFNLSGFEISLEVTGITGELMDDSVFLTLEMIRGYVAYAQVLGHLEPGSPLWYYSNATNAIIVDTGGMSDEVFESRIASQFPVASFQYSKDVREGMMSLLQSLIAIFFIFIGFGILAEVLFISTTIVLNILDRESEFVSLRTMGASPMRIRVMVVLENVLLFGAGVVVGIPISILATKWAIWYITNDLMYFNIQAGPEVYIITIIIALLSTVAASYISAKHITKLKLADIIRQKLTT